MPRTAMACQIVDAMIAKGKLLPEHRADAIKFLDRELWRRTQHILSEMAHEATQAAFSLRARD